MSQSSTPDLEHLRVDQVGSLIRPGYLKDAWAKLREGGIDEAELRAIQDRAIRELIEREDALHFPILTDGEYRRTNFQDGFAASVSGFRLNPNMMQGGTRAPTYLQTGPIAFLHNLPLEEWRFAQALTATPVKSTVISPTQIVFRFDHAQYPSDQAFLDDVVGIQRRVVHELADAGCPYVQIDAPSYAEQLDPRRLEEARARGEDPARRLERDIAADNAVLEGLQGVVTGIHLCRGGFPEGSPMLATGSYESIAERLFNDLRHDRFLLEYATERAGGFEPLRFVPKGKIVVLGLINVKTTELDAADAIKRRIEEASKYIAVEQLALSPQCGFSTTIRAASGATDDSYQWRKLELVQRIAEDVWA
jgi:5-methyltetrahydropteroyltriglutamate--homocysteine methyltransferase